MRKYIQWVILGMVLSVVFWHCKTAASEHNFTKEYYSSLGSNINRLLEMRKGVFVHYLYYPDKNEKKIWARNDDKDSTVMIVRQVGSPDKDGYWLLNYYFMTHAHEMPLRVMLQKFEMSSSSRDTIYCIDYAYTKSIAWSDVTDPKNKLEEIDFKALKPSSSRLAYVRDSLMLFRGESGLKTTSTKSKEYKFRKDFHEITPQSTIFRPVFYKDENTTEPYNYPVVQVLQKLPKNNIFYPKQSAYR